MEMTAEPPSPEVWYAFISSISAIEGFSRRTCAIVVNPLSYVLPIHSLTAAGLALPKRLSTLESQRLCNNMVGKLGKKYARFRCSSMCGPYTAL